MTELVSLVLALEHNTSTALPGCTESPEGPRGALRLIKPGGTLDESGGQEAQCSLRASHKIPATSLAFHSRSQTLGKYRTQRCFRDGEGNMMLTVWSV